MYTSDAEQRRKDAWNRLLQQLEMRQRYVDKISDEEDLARRKDAWLAKKAENQQRLAEPGSREVDWAGKGLAAGGAWGALAGATGARTVNAFEAGSHGSLWDRVKGVGKAFFSPEDLINAGKYNKEAMMKSDSLASGMGKEFSRGAAKKKTDADTMEDLTPGGDATTAPQQAPEMSQAGGSDFTFSQNDDGGYSSGNKLRVDPAFEAEMEMYKRQGKMR